MSPKTKIASVINFSQAVENYQHASVTSVEIDQIVTVAGHNPRGFATGDAAFAGEAFEELKQSIVSFGDVFQPVVLRRRANSNLYELVAGERRLRAARAAGLHSISAVVRELSDDQAYRLAREENDLRQGVAKIDLLFSALHQLASRLGVSVQATRGVLIRARDAQAQDRTLDPDGAEARALALIESLRLPAVSTLVRSARLLDLTPDERQAVREGLAEGAALALLDLGDHPQRAATLRRATAERWSARRTQDEVRTLLSTRSARPNIARLLTTARKSLSDARLGKLDAQQQQQVEAALEEFLDRVQTITGQTRTP